MWVAMFDPWQGLETFGRGIGEATEDPSGAQESPPETSESLSLRSEETSLQMVHASVHIHNTSVRRPPSHSGSIALPRAPRPGGLFMQRKHRDNGPTRQKQGYAHAARTRQSCALIQWWITGLPCAPDLHRDANWFRSLLIRLCWVRRLDLETFGLRIGRVGRPATSAV